MSEAELSRRLDEFNKRIESWLQSKNPLIGLVKLNINKKRGSEERWYGIELPFLAGIDAPIQKFVEARATLADVISKDIEEAPAPSQSGDDAPTEKQLGLARKLKIENPEQYTKTVLSQKIDEKLKK